MRVDGKLLCDAGFWGGECQREDHRRAAADPNYLPPGWVEVAFAPGERRTSAHFHFCGSACLMVMVEHDRFAKALDGGAMLHE